MTPVTPHAASTAARVSDFADSEMFRRLFRDGMDLVEETAAYRELHPLAKIPALEHGETTMFESVAIMQYILATFGPSDLEVRPGETDYGRFLQWLHFGEGGMTLPVTMLLAHTALLPEEAGAPAKEVEHKFFELLTLNPRGFSLLPASLLPPHSPRSPSPSLHA